MQQAAKMPQWQVTDRVLHGVSSNSPLPPSVETAYYRKCIELKRRINEIESSNDDLRVRKQRIERAILKMRMERTLLLENIAQQMKENPDDSDESNSPPPTPQDKPLRSKRGHRSKVTPPPSGPASIAAGNHASPTAGPSQGAFLASSQGALTPEASANRMNSQFFNAYSQPAISTPPALAAAPPTAGPASVNGSSVPLPPLAQAFPPPGSSVAPPPAYAPGHQNGEAPPPPQAGLAAANQPPEAPRAPPGEQNGQTDTEMGEAGAGGFGGGFTAVNR